MRVAVLAVQGAFIEHEKAFADAGHTVSEIRQPRDIPDSLDIIVFPGGESTVQRKLLRELNLIEPIWQRLDAGVGAYATCAGLILLANEVDGTPNPLGRLAVSVQRNAYGRQLGSFHTLAPLLGYDSVNMTFIRAPKILSCTDQVQVLSTFDGYPTAVRQGNITAFAWHPELNGKIYI